MQFKSTVATSPGQLRPLLQSQSTNSDTDSPRYAVQMYSCNLTWSNEAFAPVTEYKLRYRQSKVCSAYVQLQPHLVDWRLLRSRSTNSDTDSPRYAVTTSPGQLRPLLQSQSTNSDTGNTRYAVQMYSCNLTWSTEAFAPVTE